MNRKEFISLLGLTVLVASVIIGSPRQPDPSNTPSSITTVTVNQACQLPRPAIALGRGLPKNLEIDFTVGNVRVG